MKYANILKLIINFKIKLLQARKPCS